MERKEAPPDPRPPLPRRAVGKRGEPKMAPGKPGEIRRRKGMGPSPQFPRNGSPPTGYSLHPRYGKERRLLYEAL